MNTRARQSVCLAICVMTFTVAQAAQGEPAQLEQYRQQGITQTKPQSGRELWNSVVNERSCVDCHGADLASGGKHVKTGKAIEPMALSANPDRYQDGKKIEEWFLRNCKWTFGRECSLQEKADILTWLASQ
jgi:hypothetical protein